MNLLTRLIQIVLNNCKIDFLQLQGPRIDDVTTTTTTTTTTAATDPPQPREKEPRRQDEPRPHEGHSGENQPRPREERQHRKGSTILDEEWPLPPSTDDDINSVKFLSVFVHVDLRR